jgi:hypothetical protein
MEIPSGLLNQKNYPLFFLPDTILIRLKKFDRYRC